jgi:hypothetical protein
MPSKTPRLLKYRHNRPKDLAVVRIDGKDYYLGKLSNVESQEKYGRLIAQMLTAPALADTAQPRDDGDSGLPINELLVAFWERHVVPYSVKDGRPTSEKDNIRQALRFVRPLYGHTPAKSFSPLALETVRQAMIDAGRCRQLINKDVSRIRGMFRWAVEHELLPLAV